MLIQSERKTIDGELFEKMILGGVANLQANLQTVNDLNVFPIPDGDTGENMFLTLQGGFDELRGIEDHSLHSKAHAMAKGMLLGARGNSGVILSQLFYGLAQGLDGLACANLTQFGNALREGVRCAYGAVAHPVEGTILTVAREAVENTCRKLSDEIEIEEFFSLYLDEMKKSLEKTPDLLVVLKESGVIDSGGAGLVYITEGFCKALGGVQAENEIAVSDLRSAKALDFSRFNEDSIMEFGYCTEFLLQLQNSKTDCSHFSVQDLVTYLETVGDSVVAFQTGTIVKVHVHAMEPGSVLSYCQKYGEFLTVKIENMTLQHNETVAQKTAKKAQRARRKYATVTVASGEGLVKVFREMGADSVIAGGQTNNPSAEDFIEAFDEVNADCIFVLPNNKNIVLAAKQAANIYKHSEVRVIESKSVGEGYSALSMLDYGADDAAEIEKMLIENMRGTVTAMVAQSVRSARVNGRFVEKGHYMGFTDQSVLVSSPSKIFTTCNLLDALEIDNKDFVIAVYGNTVSEEEKIAFRAHLSEKHARVELYEIEGEQDVYDFILIVE